MVNQKKKYLSIWNTRNSDPANVEAVAAEPDYRRPCFSLIFLVAVVAALCFKLRSEAVSYFSKNSVATHADRDDVTATRAGVRVRTALVTATKKLFDQPSLDVDINEHRVETYTWWLKLFVYLLKITGGGEQPKVPSLHGFLSVIRPSTCLHESS